MDAVEGVVGGQTTFLLPAPHSLRAAGSKLPSAGLEQASSTPGGRVDLRSTRVDRRSTLRCGRDEPTVFDNRGTRVSRLERTRASGPPMGWCRMAGPMGHGRLVHACGGRVFRARRFSLRSTPHPLRATGSKLPPAGWSKRPALRVKALRALRGRLVLQRPSEDGTTYGDWISMRSALLEQGAFSLTAVRVA